MKIKGTRFIFDSTPTQLNLFYMHSLTLAIRFITIKNHDKFNTLNGGGICIVSQFKFK